MLIFVQNKERAKELYNELRYDDIRADVIHADLPEMQVTLSLLNTMIIITCRCFIYAYPNTGTFSMCNMEKFVMPLYLGETYCSLFSQSVDVCQLKYGGLHICIIYSEHLLFTPVILIQV